MKKTLSLFLVLLITLTFLSACSSKNEFVIDRIYCTTNRNLNDDMIALRDVYIYGHVGDYSTSVQIQTAFANKIVSFNAKYKSESKLDTMLTDIILTLRNDEGEECELALNVGDKFEVYTPSLPVFIIDSLFKK